MKCRIRGSSKELSYDESYTNIPSYFDFGSYDRYLRANIHEFQFHHKFVSHWLQLLESGSNPVWLTRHALSEVE